MYVWYVTNESYVILRLCALPCDEERPSLPPTNPEAQLNGGGGGGEDVSNRNLKEMCDSILLLLATSVEAMEPVLWPRLMDYLLAPDFGPAIPSIVKSLARRNTRCFNLITGLG